MGLLMSGIALKPDHVSFVIHNSFRENTVYFAFPAEFECAVCPTFCFGRFSIFANLTVWQSTPICSDWDLVLAAMVDQGLTSRGSVLLCFLNDLRYG